MPWIKASKRLPKNSILVRDQVMIKWDNGDDRILGRAKDCLEIMKNGWMDVEWFDESPSEEPNQEILWEDLTIEYEEMLNVGIDTWGRRIQKLSDKYILTRK